VGGVGDQGVDDGRAEQGKECGAGRRAYQSSDTAGCVLWVVHTSFLPWRRRLNLLKFAYSMGPLAEALLSRG
jgi:hypothetical protein